jgi:hypothetical protein
VWGVAVAPVAGAWRPPPKKNKIVLEEDLSDEEADSAGPVTWVVPAWEVLAADRGGWRAGLKGLEVNESEVDVC